MPQQLIDGSWEAAYIPNIAAWARRLDGLDMTTEHKRRYLLAEHEQTHAFLLDAVSISEAHPMRERFEEWLDGMPSIETLARAVRSSDKPKRKVDEPVGFDIPWYHQYLQTAHFGQVKQRAIAHYGTCVLCNVARDFHVHHRHYARLGCEEMQDVCLLCAMCHSKVTRIIAATLRVPKICPDAVKRILRAEGKM